MANGMPAWARDFSEKYYSRTLAMFVVAGNVHDLQPVTGVELPP